MDEAEVTLPELSDERIDEIENMLFAEIGRDRTAAAQTEEDERRRRVRRGRIWTGGAAAAAVIVVAALIAPAMPGLLSTADSVVSTSGGPLVAPNSGDGGAEAERDLSGESGYTDAAEESAPHTTSADDAREIIATAAATVRVDDTGRAAEQVSEAANALGGYVEAMSVGGEDVVPYDSYRGDGVISYPAPSGAWVTVRVPAASLTELTSGLSEIGEVTSSRIDRRDVTTEAVDLRARVTALTASVERLTALVAQAESTADLIAAEDALANRQSELESYQQQLTYLDSQVGMSTLTVTLFEPAPTVTPDPAGFGDGFAAGWNGLLASVNGVVIALGFLIPWLGVIAVAGLVVWLVRRGVKRRRRTVVDSTDVATTQD